MTDHVVQARGLRKTYGRRVALESLDLRVRPGQVVGLLGPNGAGKTTAVKLLLGLVRPTSGAGELLGRPLGDRVARARVGYLPEAFRYPPWLTVSEVLRLHCRLDSQHTGSMPGFLATVLVDRRRRTGGVVLANATTGFSPAECVIGLLEELERCEPTLAEPWRATESVPAELAGVPGVWHWGNTPVVFAMDGAELVGRRNGVEAYRFVVRDGRIVGRTGYHAGEELHVVRRPDGSVGHLEVATFVYTRRPYDPEAPIPGGAPGR